MRGAAHKMGIGEVSGVILFLRLASGAAVLRRVSVRTLTVVSPAVPSGPPQRLEVRPINSTAAVVSWQPPSSDQRNGLTSGYRLQLSQRAASFRFNVTVNSSTTQVMLKNLTAGAGFSIRLAAVNEVGTGPLSEPVHFQMAADGSAPGGGAVNSRQVPAAGLLSKAWFIASLGGALLLLTALVAVICWRRRREKKALGNITGQWQPASGQRGRLVEFRISLTDPSSLSTRCPIPILQRLWHSGPGERRPSGM